MRLSKLISHKSNIIFIMLPIIALLVSFKLFIGLHNINILAVIIACIIIFYRNIINEGLFNFKYSLYLITFIFIYFISNLFNMEYFRISSFLYSILFLLLFEIYKSYIESKQDYNYIKLIYNLIYIFYGIMTILQYVLIKINSPYVPNLISYEKGINIRVNSFATEPSYAGIIFVSLFYLNNIVFNNHNFNIFKYKTDFIKFILFVIIIILINSSYGFICFYILIIYILFQGRNIKFKIILSILLIFLIIISNKFISIYSLTRIKNVVNILPLAINEYEYLLKIDHSAAMRIVPNIIYLNNLKELNIKNIIGYGMDYAQIQMARIIPGIEEQLRIGFFPMFLINFGLVSFLAFALYLNNRLMLKRISSLEKAFQIAIITIVFTNANINTTLFWAIIFIFYTSNNYIVNFRTKNML